MYALFHKTFPLILLIVLISLMAVLTHGLKYKSGHGFQLESKLEDETVHAFQEQEVTRATRQLPVDQDSGDIIRDYAYNFLNFMLNYVGILVHTLVTKLFFTA